jgi:hypothetical protein
VNTADWALLGLAAFAVAAVTVNLRDHCTNVRLAFHDPDDHTRPAFARAVAARIREQEAAGAEETPAPPPIITEPVIYWRGHELIITQGIPPQSYAGLMVNEDPDDPGIWNITHRPSGQPIGTGYTCAEDAAHDLELVADLCDWTMPGARLLQVWPDLWQQWAAITGGIAA